MSQAKRDRIVQVKISSFVFLILNPGTVVRTSLKYGSNKNFFDIHVVFADSEEHLCA